MSLICILKLQNNKFKFTDGVIDNLDSSSQLYSFSRLSVFMGILKGWPSGLVQFFYEADNLDTLKCINQTFITLILKKVKAEKI